MPIANQPQAQEVMIKGGPGGRNYLGPPGQTAGAQDNEIVSFDGKVLIVRTATSDEIGRMNFGLRALRAEGLMPSRHRFDFSLASRLVSRAKRSTK